ncbi:MULTISPECIES: alpha/beta hydrolase [Staphylococcus]|uniref:Alpha/beta hydrolase n=1 Tax=Staphylococcus ureilyticus TaxID=94138 RepID=A0AB34AK86_STAUR|nr:MULTISPECIES: alpha/beta hydrolase [Staphylococcus]AVL76861.1 alpha/beta hydrolase [Staphylococcus cohnii]MBL0376309.1 alpha/beta hydrolase [Staphylococcus sp. S75]MBL0382903.1 alpha/beta hydrolase [Staphylococcus sp. S59]MBL0400583.1 alpha/beta hydrolase [Staphylococcus sp. S36]MCT1915120.1 alpha/beta hydrolase [Staphylococcus ureilyticus]
MTQQKATCLSRDGFSLPYSIIAAKNQSPKGVIMYFHGGGLIFGQPNDLPQAYIDILSESYHLIMVSYRLAPESHIDTIIEDALSNYDHLKSLYPSLPLITFGRSAGAFLAMLVARHRKVDSIIDFYGYSRVHVPAFLKPNKQYQALSTQITPKILNQLIQSKPLTSAPLQTRYPIYLYVRGQARWMSYLGIQASTQSTYNITPQEMKNFPPMFIVHCTGDPDVPYSESEYIARLIETSHFERLDLDCHDFDREVNSTSKAVYEQVIQFLNQIKLNIEGDK